MLRNAEGGGLRISVTKVYGPIVFALRGGGDVTNFQKKHNVTL